MGAFTKSGARVRTPRAWLWLAAVVAPCVGLVLVNVLAGRVTNGGLLALLPMTLVVQVGLLRLRHRWWRERRGEVRADERGLWLADELVVARSAPRYGRLVRRDGAIYVRLQRHLWPVEVVVDDEREGAALLAGMRLDASRSIGSYPMTLGTRRGFLVGLGVYVASFALLGLLVGMVPQEPMRLVLFGAWWVPLLVWVLHRDLRVTVGADGLHLRRYLSSSRFIPFDAVDATDVDRADVRLRLRDGSVTTMHHGGGGRVWRLLRDEVDEGLLLVARIDEQVERHRRGGPTSVVLARGARPTRVWLREASSASEEHALFRTPAIPLDELWRVVEDPVVATTTRAGAALALRDRLDDDGRARLRALADACAASALRVALQRVASGATEQELEDAYDDLDELGMSSLPLGDRST